MRALIALAAAAVVVSAGLTTAAAPAQAVTTDRIAGAERYATSVAVSRATASTGSTVFLASGETFPDALAAGPVAAAEGAHLLLTARAELPSIVRDRIRELAPSDIVVVGAEASVSARVATQAAAVNGARITRIGGTDRVDTSLRLLERLASKGPVERVWVASGFDFPDALVAASVAGRERAAVVLDHHGGSAADSRAWVERVRPHVAGRAVRIAGGEPSVSAADAQRLRGVGAASVDRFGGADRFATARIINDRFATTAAGGTMLLTTGANFPDALSGAVHAAVRGVPMYLTTPACSAPIAQMLREEAAQRGVTRVVGLGDTNSISQGALSLGPCALTLQEQIGQAYGTFTARSYSGSGDRVIDLGQGIPYAQVRFTMSASGVNSITAIDANGRVVDSPVSVTGAHSGAGLLATPDRNRPARYLEVYSQGAWTIEVRDLSSAPVLSSIVEATDDAVLLYGGGARGVQATHAANGYFGVRQLHSGGRLTSPIDGWMAGTSSSGQLQAGPSVLDVLGDGSWSLTLR